MISSQSGNISIRIEIRQINTMKKSKGFLLATKAPELRIFLDKSPYSDGHGIWLEIAHYKSDVKAVLLEVHNHVTQCYKYVHKYKETLKTLKLKDSCCSDNRKIVASILSQHLFLHGAYITDDASCALNIETNERVWLVPPISKPYVAQPLTHDCLNNGTWFDELSRSPDLVFSVAKASGEIASLNGNAILFSSYFTAAYVADYFCSINNLDYDAIPRLMQESNKIQGKI